MRRDVKTDWKVREDVKAKLRSQVKRLLTRYKYPPDRQPAAIKLVLEQMERSRRPWPPDRAVCLLGLGAAEKAHRAVAREHFATPLHLIVRWGSRRGIRPTDDTTTRLLTEAR